MRCSYCARYMHKLHKSVIEHDDGSADVCDCPRCNEHERAVIYNLNPEYAGPPPTFDNQNYGVVTISTTIEGAPPPHPQSVDRGKYRIAEEPQGTNPGLPWQLTRCIECGNPVWAKNQRSVERSEAVCEDDYYNMVSNHYEEMGKQQRRVRNRIPNPFS